jgi:hypothetical protein
VVSALVAVSGSNASAGLAAMVPGEKPEKDPANDSHEQFLSLGVRAQLPPLALAKTTAENLAWAS